MKKRQTRAVCRFSELPNFYVPEPPDMRDAPFAIAVNKCGRNQ
ncbi:hypothetical protein [Candidatus Leptofilum sp.]